MSTTPVHKDTQSRLRSHAHVLCKDIGERTLRSGGLKRAESYIFDTFAHCGLAPERQEYRFRGHSVANLTCQLGDALGDAPGDPVVVGAHYDTVPGTEGADDNASGICLLLELAARLARHPPALPVRLVAFTLEEPPAFHTRSQGSRVFCRHLKRSGERARAAVVLEMVGYTAARQHYPLVLSLAGYPKTGDFIGVVGNLRSRALTRALKRAFQNVEGLPVETLCVPFNGWILPATRLSDHSSFWDRGWPAVMVSDTAFFRNPNYHTPADRLETLDFDFMARVAEGLEQAIRGLAPGRSGQS